MGELARVWLARLEAEGCASLVDRQSFVRAHVEPWAFDLPVPELTFDLVNAYVCARRADKYQPETLWTIGYSWSALAGEAGIAIRVADLDLPRRSRTSCNAVHALTLEEWTTLVRSTAGDLTDRILVRLMLCTALRLGEALGARWRDLEITDTGWWLVISEQLHEKTGKRRQTKDRSTREIPVRGELRAVLEEARTVYFDGNPAPDAPLALFVPSGTGGRRAVLDLRAWDQRTANKHWRAFLAEHGIAGRPLISARHTLPGLLIEAGASRLAVQSLTHPGSLPRSVDGGERGSFGRYVHFSRSAKYRAVAALDTPQLELPKTSEDPHDD